MVKPSASMTMPTPISDSGIVTIGMITERSDAMNSRITRITITAASARVFATSWIDSSMNIVES